MPVYEQVVGDNIVMRRQKDDWINATHVLKVADLDKPARTRVLEKEIQTSTHEKIQGGYGRFQGMASLFSLHSHPLTFRQALGSRSPKL